jgi:hypothetical protein
VTERSIRQIRKSILLEIRGFNQKIGAGPNDYVAPDSLKWFRAGDKAFLAAVNELLQQGLLIGIADADKRVAVRLNLEKIADINDELATREWYEDPRFLIPTILAILGAAGAMIKFIFKL